MIKILCGGADNSCGPASAPSVHSSYSSAVPGRQNSTSHWTIGAAKKVKKAAAGQKEMRLPIAGKKPERKLSEAACDQAAEFGVVNAARG